MDNSCMDLLGIIDRLLLFDQSLLGFQGHRLPLPQFVEHTQPDHFCDTIQCQNLLSILIQHLDLFTITFVQLNYLSMLIQHQAITPDSSFD